MPQETDNARADGKSAWRTKLAVFVLLGVIVAVVSSQFSDTLTAENLARQESQLRVFQQAYPVIVYGVAFVLYVFVTGLSLPGATVLTLIYGWYFGFLPAVVLVSFASTTGASVAFLLSRFLFHDWVQNRFGKRLIYFNQALEREGPFFLFMLRLIPAVPFVVINAVMGLTPIRLRTFWWVSQLGMLAGTAVYVYAGSSVPEVQTLADEGLAAIFSPGQIVQIIAAFALLGAFPLLARFTIKYIFRRKPAGT